MIKAVKDTLRQTFRTLRSLWRRIQNHGLGTLSLSQPHWGQFGEDVILQALFREKTDGFFVDVGAHHPVRISNTYQLSQTGWRGINIEPLPGNYALFEKDRPRDININCAISERPGLVSFVVDGVYSGIDADSFPSEYRREKRSKIQVKTLPLRSVFEEHLPKDQEIDVMSVDCEGHDLVALKSNDWTKYRPKVLLFEIHKANDLISFAEEQGYEHFLTTGLTAIFLEQSFVRTQI